MLDHDQLQISKTALIVVDVQNDFCHKEGVFSKYKKVNLDHIEKAVKNLSAFIETCRPFHVPIVFVKTIHSPWTDSPSWRTRMSGAAEKMDICLRDSWGSHFYNIAPKEMDCIVTKHRYSAFFGTDLDLILKTRGIENIMVTGVVTNVCVETTARDGFNRDYNVILVEDCCGAFDRADHAATLNNIDRFFGTVITSSALVDILKNQEKGGIRIV